MPPVTRRTNSLRSTRSKSKPKRQEERKHDDNRSKESQSVVTRRNKSKKRRFRQSGPELDDMDCAKSEPRTRLQKRKAESVKVDLSSQYLDPPRPEKMTRRHPAEVSLVTPSPNVARSITKVSHLEGIEKLKTCDYSSSNSSFEERPDEESLPEGVNSIHLSSPCLHNDHNSASSLTESFIKSYGREYHNSLSSVGNDLACESSDRFKASPSVSSMSPGICTRQNRRRSPRLLQKRVAQLSSPSSISSSSIDSSIDSQSCLGSHSHSRRKNGIGEKARAILISWIVEVGMEYKLAQITLHTAIGLVDRSLAIATIINGDSLRGIDDVPGLALDRSTLQLLGW